MLEDGEDLATLSRTLGHADLSTTADVYAHLTSRMLERSAARMDSILTPNTPKFSESEAARHGWKGVDTGKVPGNQHPNTPDKDESDR